MKFFIDSCDVKEIAELNELGLVDGVTTKSTTIAGLLSPKTTEELHNELANCNPSYLRASQYITTKPRWMRSAEETAVVEA